MTRSHVALFCLCALLQTPVGDLSGEWVFSAETSEGVLLAGLALEDDGERLVATLRIDNHVLRGEGTTNGSAFRVLLRHADGSGPGHGEVLTLEGRLEDGGIVGTFENDTDRGTWTARRR